VECVGVLATRGGYIVGVAILALRSEVSTDLDVVTCIAVNVFSGQTLEFWCRDRPLGEYYLSLLKFDFVAFYALAEPLPRRAVVFWETLSMRRKLAADHALYSVVFGHQGAALTCMCCRRACAGHAKRQKKARR
jgi:hypothetical protein